MGGAEGLGDRDDRFIGADQFDAIFGNMFFDAGFPEEGRAARQRPELALSQNLPAATVISRVATCPGREQGVFDGV